MSSHDNKDPKGFEKPLRSKPPLIVIVGPTAVGKTEISLQLAEQLDGEIVSADSRLFYRGMDIGTAKPPPAERARVPHHLIDVAEPDETWSLAVFQKAARQAIADIHQRGRLPFLVGGTGQYVRAVTHEWTLPAQGPHPRLRAALEALAQGRGRDWLHTRLSTFDPAAAERIDPRNLRRTIRALEVIFVTGKRFSAQRGLGESPYRLLTIGLIRPRPELYARLDARIEAMFVNGLLDEVQTLLGRGYSPDLPSMSAIGYRQCTDFLHGKMSREQTVNEIKRATRVFVRRQANWFKPDNPEIHWFDPGEVTVSKLAAFIQTTLPRNIEKGEASNTISNN
jgi:tRNA dimethylallyltransferase